MAIGKSWIQAVQVPSYSLGTGWGIFCFQETYDEIANTSTITLEKIHLDHSTYSGWTSFDYTLVIDGVTVAMSNAYGWNPSTGTGVDVAVGISYTVAHNYDGEKSITVSCSNRGFSVGSFSMGESCTNSQTVVLTAIPRASSISATDANIGSVSTITVNRKSTNYTHTIHCAFHDVSMYVTSSGGLSSTAEKMSATSIGFVIPTSFYSKIPNSKSSWGTLTITTYSGNTQIGSQATCTFNIYAVESECSPDVSGTVVDTNETTISLTGDASKLVRFYSNVLATITATAKNSATISSKSIAGVTVSENTRTIDAVETDSFIFSATDSRGYSKSVTVENTLVPYIKLTCNVSLTRDDPTSGNATLTVSGNYFNASFGAESNTLTLTYSIAGGEAVSITPTISGNAYSATVGLSGLDYKSTFAFEIVTTDKLMAVAKNETLNKGIPNFHMGENDVTFEVPVKLYGNVMPKFACNPNLLDNWYFVNPVNQRGQTSYSGGFIRTIDRWNSGGSTTSTLTVDNGILLQGDGTGESYWYQRINETLPAGIYTFSVLFEDNTGLLALNNEITDDGGADARTIASEGVLSFTFTYAGDAVTQHNYQRIVVIDSARIIAAKLEFGDTQTLAHLENGAWVLNEIPNYELELVKCRRYYIPHHNGWWYAIWLYGWGFCIPIPATMRAHPSVIVGNKPQVFDPSYGWRNMSYASIAYTKTEILLFFSIDDGADLSQGSYLITNVPALSAEL